VNPYPTKKREKRLHTSPVELNRSQSASQQDTVVDLLAAVLISPDGEAPGPGLGGETALDAPMGLSPFLLHPPNEEEDMYPYTASTGYSAEERESLIIEHLSQVRLIARKIHERLPESVSIEDLVSTGIVGLISAIDRFDPSLNVKLKTYAEYKIRGAILDSLRGLDWAPRQQRKKAKLIEAAIASAEQKLKRAPREEEIASELGVSMEEYHCWLVEIRGVNLGSLESGGNDEDNRDLLRFVADKEENWPSNVVERSELERLLAEAIQRMPQIERTVLSLYYQKELTLREISKVVNLHESRISQLKSQAVLRLRSYLEKRWPLMKGA
jgi:RNA polymerase sigma factor FliA